MMEDYRQLLRLWKQGASTSSMADALGVKRDTVRDALTRIVKAYGSLDSVPAEASDEEIQERIRSSRDTADCCFMPIDCDDVLGKRRNGDTYDVLWADYVKAAKEKGWRYYGRSRFCEIVSEYARINDVEDNPKETKIFGQELSGIVKRLEIADSDLWDTDDHTLWMANLYPECDTVKEAVAAALNVYDLVHGSGDIKRWKNTDRKSLCSGFGDADPAAIIAWNQRMRELVRMDEIAMDIRSGKPAREAGRLAPLTGIQQEWLAKRYTRSDFSEIIRLNYYIGTALGGKAGDPYISACFRTISDTILADTMGTLQYNDTCRMVMDRHTVKLPLRVNWGGGWSDTPPVCIEMGGTVLNAAISLNGELPVEATLIRIPEKKIVFDSRDMDVHGASRDG